MFKESDRNTAYKTILTGRTDLSEYLKSIWKYSRLYLEQGKLIGQGETERIIAEYPESIYSLNPGENRDATGSHTHVREWSNTAAAPGNEIIRMRRIAVHNENRSTDESIYVDEKIVIEMEFDKLNDQEPINIALRVNDMNGIPLFLSSPLQSVNTEIWKDYLSHSGIKSLRCLLHENILNSLPYATDVIYLNLENNVLIQLPYMISFMTFPKEINNAMNLYKAAKFPLLPDILWKIDTK